MQISLITPARKLSRNGNRTTALRWARMLRGAGHRVRVDIEYTGEAADLMIAIHAWSSAESIQRFRNLFPGGLLIVGLGGTDVNTFLNSNPEMTLRSMEMADALICLHDLIGEALPAKLRRKLHVVRQSALPLPPSLSAVRRPSTRHFDICVIGHLRDEKDPFRAALAARRLPVSSKLRITHLGKAHTAAFARQAVDEMAINPRYRWLGEVPAWRVRREFAKTRLMVISSNQEGGANVVSEAVVADVHIIASDIPGNIGLLGRSYEGYYPVRDEVALAGLLERCETEPKFLDRLERSGRKLKPMFSPAREASALRQVINSITN